MRKSVAPIVNLPAIPAQPGATDRSRRMSAPSAAQILDTPLPQLLDELHVGIYDSNVSDADFFGAAVQRKNGDIVLAMPAGRTELEHDTVARYLLAQAFGTELPQLPAPFVTQNVGELA